MKEANVTGIHEQEQEVNFQGHPHWRNSSIFASTSKTTQKFFTPETPFVLFVCNLILIRYFFQLYMYIWIYTHTTNLN